MSYNHILHYCKLHGMKFISNEDELKDGENMMCIFQCSGSRLRPAAETALGLILSR